MGKSKYKFIGRKRICSNSKFDVLFDNLISQDNQEINDFLVIKPKVNHKGYISGICVLPMYRGKFCLMNVWRHQFKNFVYQAPAGFIEENEKPHQTAIRELKEETSLICEKKNMIFLGTFIPDAALIECRVALFLAKNCMKSPTKVEREIGSSDIIYLSKKEIKELIIKEENIGGSTLVTCIRSLIHLDLKDASINSFYKD